MVSSRQSASVFSDFPWSPAEKKIARRAFDLALRRELEAVVTETKLRVEKIREPAEVWDLEHYLTKRRQEIDREFDYRYSVLIFIFGNLIRQGKLRVEELHGLSQDKLESIRQYVDFQVSPSSKEEV